MELDVVGLLETDLHVGIRYLTLYVTDDVVS